jgi:hypothetical protein
MEDGAEKTPSEGIEIVEETYYSRPKLKDWGSQRSALLSATFL